MKKDIHPKMYTNAKVTDLSSGKTFNLASTKEEITVEVSNLSHPFYTGKQQIIDTENLVKKFETRRQVASKNINKVQQKRAKRKARSQKTTSVKAETSLTLKDMLKQLQ